MCQIPQLVSYRDDRTLAQQKAYDLKGRVAIDWACSESDK